MAFSSLAALDEACFALSPWHGVLELIGAPGEGGCPWGIKCWNGLCEAYVAPETLRPLTAAAAAMLGRKMGDQVWDDARKRAWEHEPIAFAF